MKITFVSPAPNLSGGIRVIATQADLLAARGHDVTVVAPHPRSPGLKARTRALLKGRWLRRPSAESHFDSMQAKLSFYDHRGPARDGDVPDADVVIATWWQTAFAVNELSPAKGRKYYFVQHHEVHSHLPRDLSSSTYALPLKKIVVSGWLRDIMSDTYGDPDVAVVPNSVNTDLFFSIDRKKQSVPTVGLMYSTKSFKGVDVALRAIAQLQRITPVRVVAFGTESPSVGLSLPSDARFFLRPAQRDLRRIYAMCDVFLAASRAEGFGLPILEAMACGTPVVATRTGCAGDAICDGINGFVTDIDDVGGLAERLSKVLDSSEERWERMSSAAAKAVTSYTWEDAAEKLEAALSQGDSS